MIPMTFSISKPRKIGHPIHSNTTYLPNKPYKINDMSYGSITDEPNSSANVFTSSKLYSYSVRMSMLDHMSNMPGCTDCPK